MLNLPHPLADWNVRLVCVLEDVALALITTVVPIIRATVVLAGTPVPDTDIPTTTPNGLVMFISVGVFIVVSPRNTKGTPGDLSQP